MRSTGGGPANRTARSGLLLVAAAAALWGSDAIFRRALALELPAATVVFYEHLILTLFVLPLLITIPWRSLRPADLLCLVGIGAGASALATVLFTAAFRYGDPTTPLLLQKLQPLVALLAARLVLGERLQRPFRRYFAIAMVAAWLITFANPVQVTARSATAGGLAAAAAVLWGLGTVLGRRMSGVLSTGQLTAARFGIGLPVSFLPLVVSPATFGTPAIPASAIGPLLLLAFIPGLLALTLYYRGLQSTPASAATVAELAFPLSALALNYIAFGATVSSTQVVGIVLLSGLVLRMSMAARRAGGLGIAIGPPRVHPPILTTTQDLAVHGGIPSHAPHPKPLRGDV